MRRVTIPALFILSGLVGWFESPPTRAPRRLEAADGARAEAEPPAASASPTTPAPAPREDPAEGWRPVSRPARNHGTAGYAPIRPPVLGLVVEEDRSLGRSRLVRLAGEDSSVDPTREILLEGTRKQCEEDLVRRLEAQHGTGHLNIPFATFGGKQLWGDRFVSCGWRVQENVITGISRLLDPEDRRVAWGSYEACRTVFERHRLDEGIRPSSRQLVVLVHGLFRSRHGFRSLSRALWKAGFQVEAISYPSTRGTIREHAARLDEVLSGFDGFDSVCFITHSLGGLVVREALAHRASWQERLPVRRLVMLAPPNRGSVIADTMKDWLPFRAFAGVVGQDLTPEHVRDLPVPACEFGVIAGGTGTEDGINPLLPGDNDGTVRVESTKLPGMQDFLRVKVLHSFVMENERVIEAAIHFLDHGRFLPLATEIPQKATAAVNDPMPPRAPAESTDAPAGSVAR